MEVMQTLAVVAIPSTTPAAAQTPVAQVDWARTPFSLVAPDSWTIRTGGLHELADIESGDSRLVSRARGLQPENNDAIWMGFVSPADVRSLEEDRRYLLDIGTFLVTDEVVTAARPVRIGNRPTEVTTGTAHAARVATFASRSC